MGQLYRQVVSGLNFPYSWGLMTQAHKMWQWLRPSRAVNSDLIVRATSLTPQYIHVTNQPTNQPTTSATACSTTSVHVQATQCKITISTSQMPILSTVSALLVWFMTYLNIHKLTVTSAVVVASSWSRQPRPVIGRGTLPRVSVVIAAAGASTQPLVVASWGSKLSGSTVWICGSNAASGGAITIGGGRMGRTGVTAEVTELFQLLIQQWLSGCWAVWRWLTTDVASFLTGPFITGNVSLCINTPHGCRSLINRFTRISSLLRI